MRWGNDDIICGILILPPEVSRLKTEIDYEKMTERELLIELIKEQKKEIKGRNYVFLMMVIILLSIAISLVYIIPKVSAASANTKKAAEKLTELVDEAEVKLNSLDTVVNDIDGMVKNVDKLVVANTKNLSEAVEKVNQIDFDKLNKAISDFSDTVEPLANFFNKFKTP